MPATRKHGTGPVHTVYAYFDSEYRVSIKHVAHHNPVLLALAEKCIDKRIWYLYDLDGGWEAIKQQLKKQLCGWKFKPSQDPGTVPSSALDIRSSRQASKLDDEQTLYFLQTLDTVIEKLCKGPSAPGKAPIAPAPSSRPATPAPSPSTRQLSHARSSTTSSNKNLKRKLLGTDLSAPDPLQDVVRMPPRISRSSTSYNTADDSVKSKRRKSTLDDHFTVSKPAPPQSVPLKRSFDTTASSPSPPHVLDTPQQVFSQANSSATTLDLDDDQSQGMFPTQDAVEVLQAHGVTRPLDSLETLSQALPAPMTITEKIRLTLQPLDHALPKHLSFESRWEIESLSHAWEIKPVKVFHALEQKLGNSEASIINDSFRRWDAIKAVANDYDRHNLNGPSGWSPAAKLPLSQKTWKSTYLTATLKWSHPSSNQTFHVQLNGPSIDRSCRFHRRYGGTRFIVLNLPLLRNSKVPSEYAARPHNLDVLEDEIVDWLESGKIYIAGRSWRVFYIEDDSKEIKETRYKRVHLFATDGVGLRVCSASPEEKAMRIEDFLDWQTPFSYNLTSTDLKLFQRYKLGLSKTWPTVVLDQSEFIESKDKLGTDGKTLMNDGCSLMSYELGNEIRKILGLTELPAAFQGRIGGAKGLWVVDRWRTEHPKGQRGFWIEITPAQLKIKPHPAKRTACDLQRTFEVLEWSHSTRAAGVNHQFVTTLHNRGVPPHVLKDRLEDWIQAYYNELCDAGRDGRQVRAWLQKYHPASREAEIKILGAMPDDETEQIHMLLDAGFSFADSCWLHTLLKEKITSCMNTFIDKLRITIPDSTYCYCVADPCDILKEGQVHLGFSIPWVDETKGTIRSYISDCHGLVARNPANLPSDIQKVEFVHDTRLADLRDVIVFSTKGKTPLASLLSGGDYDGDKAWVCWDADVVSQFKNSPYKPPAKIELEDYGLVDRSKKLQEIFSLGYITSKNVSTFLRNATRFNLRRSLLGVCTNAHQALVYHDSLTSKRANALQTASALKVAILAAQLVDAAKQGYELSDDSWTAFRAKTCGPKQLPTPAFKIPAKEVGDGEFNRLNVVDFLKFGVARVEADRILTLWGKRRPQHNRDTALIQPYVGFKQETLPATSGGLTALGTILSQLESDIENIFEQWCRATHREIDSETYRQAVTATSESFKALRPAQSARGSPIFTAFTMSEDKWISLKASAFYCQIWKRKEKLVWAIAGDELCIMKAQSLGPTRTMTSSMYASTKVDTKNLSRWLNGVDPEPAQPISFKDDLLTSFD